MDKESHPTCRVFISHSSKDDEFCTRLAKDLRRSLSENAVWYDNLSLRSGDNWWRIIVEEVALCDVFILIISPSSMASRWVQNEYDMALRNGKRIVPLLYRETETKDIWPDLKGIHYISFTDPERYKSVFGKLLQDLPVNNIMPEEGNLKKLLDAIPADFAAKNWHKLIYVVEELKKLRPGIITSLLYYWQGKAFLELDYQSDAIEAFEKAHAMESDEKLRLAILTELIPLLASQQQWIAVEKSTAIALKIAPNESMFLNYRCNALQAILESTSDRKQLPALLYDLCATLALLGRWDDMLNYTNKALQLVPGNPDFLAQRRDALLAMLNNHKPRLKFLRELCSILMSLKQWDDILRYTEDALLRVPDDRHFLMLRRDVLQRLLPDALDQEQRLKLLRELCQVLISLHQWDDLLLYSKEALQLAPDDSSLLTQRCDVLQRLLRDAQNQAQHLKLLRELCLVFAAQGQWEEVLDYASKVRRTSPKEPDIIRLQNHARIHLGALKVVAAYNTCADWMKACAAYWGRFVQNLLSGLQQLQQLIRRRWFVRITSTLLLLLMIFGFIHFILFPPSKPVQPQRVSSSMVIKIGINLPGNGDSNDNGLSIRYGVELAIQDANAAHYKYKFEPYFLDEVSNGSSPDPGQASNDMQTFIADAQVAGVIGPYESNIAEAIMRNANMAPIALLSPSNTYPCLTKNTAIAGCSGKNNILPTLRPTKNVTYFRLATTDDYQGPAIADYLFKNLKPQTETAYVIDDGEVYGLGLATAFINKWNKLHGSVLTHKSDANADDYPSLVQAMITNPPDVVFFAGRTDRGAEAFYNQMKSHDELKKTVYAGGSGLVSPPDFISIVDPITNSIYGSFPFVDVANLSLTENFQTYFKQVEGPSKAVYYGKYTPAGYDSANVLIQAIKKAISKGAFPPSNASDANGAKTFRQAVIDAIKSTSFIGKTGPISFDANGDTENRFFTIYAVVHDQSDWGCLEQVTINNPSTVTWLNQQKLRNGKMCHISER